MKGCLAVSQKEQIKKKKKGRVIFFPLLCAWHESKHRLG